jgi:putative ABC transport system substrate-binding protein
MRRRDFIALLGSATAWPFDAQAQQRPVPVIGFLHSAAAAGASKNVDAFRQGLRETGYVEGQNVAIEYRWAENRYEQLPALTADLVQRRVSAIVAAGAGIGAHAIKSMTSTIPIIFLIGSDPIAEGLVTSLNPRSGNITGSTFYSSQLGPKRFELLHELVPTATSLALLVNPDNVNITRTEVIPVSAAAHALGIPIQVVNARAERDFETAFATLIQERAGALIICTAALFNNRIEQLVSLAARHAIPTIYFLREFVEAGGLMSYGASITNHYRQGGNYAGRILQGAKPHELPIMQPTRFELVINLKTAKALGLAVPRSFLALANEVIE